MRPRITKDTKYSKFRYLLVYYHNIHYIDTIDVSDFFEVYQGSVYESDHDPASDFGLGLEITESEDNLNMVEVIHAKSSKKHHNDNPKVIRTSV